MNKPFYTAGEMSVKDYQDIYNAILALSLDVEDFSVSTAPTEEEVAKSELIEEIVICMTDVPLSRANWVLEEQWKTLKK